MSDALLLGFDLGGSGARCLLLDPERGTWVSSSRSWSHHLRPIEGGLGSAIDLEGLWQTLCAASREALERAGARGEAVVGVAASAMRFASVVLDGEGRPLLAAPNRDARGTPTALRLAAEHGASLHETTGHWPVPILAAGRLRWLAENEPDAFAKAAHALSLGEWVTWKLCGEAASERSAAGGSLLYDLAEDDWSWTWIERLELPARLFPPLRNAGERLGSLGSEAAAALGLAAGTPVAVGGVDTQCALLAAGAVEPGDVGIVAGSSAPMQCVVDRPLVDPEHRLWTEPHVVAGRWVVESNAGPAGECLAWLARLLDPDAPDPVARLLAQASAAQPGADGLISTLGAVVMDAREMSVPVAGLDLTHLSHPDAGSARSNLARAGLEGAAYSLRANLDQLRDVAGREQGALRMVGGLTRSEFWSGLVSDVLGAPLEVGPAGDASALGAALCAGAAAGLWTDPASGERQVPLETRTRTPDPERTARYDELFPTWRNILAARSGAVTLVRQHALPDVMRALGAAAGFPSQGLRPRILVTADADDTALESLARIGLVEHASFREKMRLLTGPSLVDALAGVQVFITEVDVVGADALLELPELRVVATCRSDAVNVDVVTCTALGIPVLHAPGRNAESVADLTLAFLLSLSRHLSEATSFLRDPSIEAGDMGRMGQAFSRLRGRELWGSTVGLVGLGAVGRAVARRLRPFGARVLVADPMISPEQAVLADAELVSMERLLEESDFVSLHAAVTDSSRGLIGQEALARMKPGACLINTARAALVDEEALAEALGSGELGGAALDVFSVEPPGADHPLLRAPGVMATPHVGGNTAEVAAHQGRIVANDLQRLLAGGRPLHVLNPEVLESFDWSGPRVSVDAATRKRLLKRPAPAVSDLQGEGGSSQRRTSPARVAPSQVPEEVLAAMEAILGGFVEGIASDGALARFSEGADVALHFALVDLPLAFHMSLRGGTLTAALGDPDLPAEVELRMPADVLDGMFTGRVNAMQEAMGGRLSFSGDTAKAMTLQHIQGDLERLYRAAREAAGDPGDLTALASGGTPLAEAGRQGEDGLRVELLRVVEDLYGQELITATGGNVSTRIPGSDEIWITPSQLFKGDLRPEMLVRLGLDGRRLDPDGPSPSSERMMHCAIYRAKPEARAVVHAHAPHATILANTDLPFLPISTEAAFFGEIPRVPFIMPGTDALAEAVGQAISDGWAVLMKNHGLIVAGRSLRRAADMAEIIDRAAQIILGCHAVGREPPTLPDEVIAELRKMGDLVA